MIWNNTINEFIKIAAKPRSYISLIAITVLVGIILFAFKMDGETYIGFITSSFEQSIEFNGKILNGNLMAFIVTNMLVIHIPLLIALVSGDLISGEAAMGTIRILASKPLSRTQIILSKFIAGAFYTFLVTFWLAFLALFFGKILFGEGDLMVLNSDGLVILKNNDVVWRFIGGYTVAFFALLTVTSIAICLSCFSDNSIGPIVMTMAIIVLFTIIGTLDVQVFDSIKPFLFTTHMAAWRNFFENPLPLNEIKKSIIVLLGHIVCALGISIYYYNKKDILS